MLLKKYYKRKTILKNDLPESILFTLMEDLLDRRGFGDVWDDCDEVVKEEILQTNLKKIQEQISSKSTLNKPVL